MAQKEYIDREALIAEYDRVHKGPAGGARKLMVDAPAVDAVEVTRCKDCVYKTVTIDGEYDTHDIVCGYFMSDGFDGNDFCSYGKKENE